MLFPILLPKDPCPKDTLPGYLHDFNKILHVSQLNTTAAGTLTACFFLTLFKAAISEKP
jgi:hypothetical protein